MVSGHHIRLIQVSNFLDLNIYAKIPWGPRVSRKILLVTLFGKYFKNSESMEKLTSVTLLVVVDWRVRLG